MSSLATLERLGAQLLSCADAALLDAPLDGLGERVHDPEARDVLLEIHAAGEADCMRELLQAQRLVRWVLEVSTAREAEALCGQLRRWLGFGQAGADDPERLATVEPVPRELEALLAWSRRYDLLGELIRPVTEVLPPAVSLPRDTSLVQCCLGELDEAVRALHPMLCERVTQQARAYLGHQAAAYAAVPARKQLWQRPLAADALRSLQQRLLGAVAGGAFELLHGVRFVPVWPISVDSTSGVCRARVRAGELEAPIGVQLFLSGYEQRALHGACERCREAGCLHVRALAARLVDACHDADDRLLAKLVEFVAVPSWQRFLRALEPEHAATESSDERLWFQLRVDRDRIWVGAMRQTPGAPGTAATSKLVSPDTLLRARACGEHDRPALEAMRLLHRARRPQLVAADLFLLRALVEHPSLRLEGGEALQLSEQTLCVELLEQPDGLLPKVTLAGAPLTAGSRRNDVGYVFRHDPAGGTLALAALTPALRRLLAALADFHGVLPQASHAWLAPWVAELRKVAQVTAPALLNSNERPAPCKLLLRITPGLFEGIDVELCVRALPLAPLWSPGQGPSLVHGLEAGQPVFARRDLADEQAKAEQVIDALRLREQVRIEPFSYRVETRQLALTLLREAARLHELLELEWAERAPKLACVGSLRTADLALGVSKRGEWLALEGGAQLPDASAQIAIGRLLSAARQGERFVCVRGDDYVEIERELFERLERAQLYVRENLREPALPSAAAPAWLAEFGAQTTGRDATSAAWLAHLQTQPSAAAEVPAEWHDRLRPYQRQGVAWLLARSRWTTGVCLADEMGLGKTVQAIALLTERSGRGPALVVAPTSVVSNWQSELARFAPQLRAMDYRGAGRAKQLSKLVAGDVLLCSYELLLRDREHFSQLRFATQIVDEAQLIKNARTQRARAVAAVASEFRVALSGTPLENRMGDLFSLFHLITPGLFGSWTQFRHRFAVPIERYENAERAAALRALLSPFLLRRTKCEVATELPARTEVVHRIEASRAEQALYAAALRHAQRALRKKRHVDDTTRSVQILAELTRLRQLACHPRLVVQDERVASSKLAALLRLLEDILPRGHRVLVFSQFTRHLALVREALDAASYRYEYLDGRTPVSERARAVERFQRGGAALFLISLKAGGTGLNLTAADYVVHMDPWWNPAAEAQASDRAHRLGQTHPVTIVKLVTQGTIEEKVLALHTQKRRLADAVLNGDAAPIELDAETLEALLSA